MQRYRRSGGCLKIVTIASCVYSVRRRRGQRGNGGGIEFPRYPAPKVDVPRHAYGKEIWKVGDQGARNSDSEPEKKRHPLPGGVQPVSRTSFINFLVVEREGGGGGRGTEKGKERARHRTSPECKCGRRVRFIAFHVCHRTRTSGGDSN